MALYLAWGCTMLACWMAGVLFGWTQAARAYRKHHRATVTYDATRPPAVERTDEVTSNGDDVDQLVAGLARECREETGR